MVTVWGVENFFWIALDGDGLANYNHFGEFGLPKERMVTAESGMRFGIRSQIIAKKITCLTFLKKTLKTTYIF